MKCCSSIISKEDFGNLTYEKLVEKINEIPTTTIKELRYSDLYQPRNSCHGIYIIKSPDNKYYFGKATGRSVAERIGGHIDSRKSSYMNSLLKNVAGKQNNYDDLHQTYSKVLGWEFSVLFVEGNSVEDKDVELIQLITVAEQMLIYHFKNNNQCLNGCNRKQPYLHLERPLFEHMKK